MVILPGRPEACDGDYEVVIVSPGAVPQSCQCWNLGWSHLALWLLASVPLDQHSSDQSFQSFGKDTVPDSRPTKSEWEKWKKPNREFFKSFPFPTPPSPWKLPSHVPSQRTGNCISGIVQFVFFLTGWFHPAQLSSQLICLVARVRIPCPSKTKWHSIVGLPLILFIRSSTHSFIP